MRIDFHSHILPGIDDGAADVETSLKLLRMLHKQGVERVALTPHFYAHRMSVERFLQKRDEAFKRLLDAIGDEPLPQLMLGAEVAMEYDLEQVDNLKSLCLQGTPFLLIELPIRGYSPWMLDKVISICYANESRPMLAHLDRYIGIYRDAELERIAEDADCVLQLNVSSLLNMRARKKMLSWIQNDEKTIVFGSDSHNLSTRAPQFDKAMKFLGKKVDRQQIRMIEWNAKKISKGEIPPFSDGIFAR